MSIATRATDSPRRSSAPHIAVFASVVLTLLVFASAAAAAATGDPPPASATPATGAIPVVEQVAATAANVVPVERPQAPAPSPEPQPAETPQGASIPDSIRENVVSAVDEPAASNLTASTRSAARSAASVVDSVSTQTTSVVSAKTGPVGTVVADSKRRVGALDESVRQNSEAVVEGVRQNFSGTVAQVRQGVAEKITGLSDRVTQRPDGALLPPALPSAQMAPASAPLPSDGPLQISGGSAQDGPLSFLEPQPGFFLDWNPIAPGGFTAKFLASGKLGAVEKVGPALHRSGTPSLSTMSGGGGLGSATPDGPTPPDIPLPAPRLPDAVGSDSGGAFFVPFAALLALLALVAPASTRRLREAPDFRVPTPFVCALERPG